RRGPYAAYAKRQLAGLRLRTVDEVDERLERAIAAHGEDVLRSEHLAQRLKLVRLVRQRRDDVRLDRQRTARGESQRVAVRFRGRDGSGSDRARRAIAVYDHNGFAEELAEPVGAGSRNGVDDAT